MQDKEALALGLWLTISDLAQRKGVNKSAISRRVARLQADGAIAVRHGKGGAKLVNIVEYDRATKTTDRAEQIEPAGMTFRQAQTREKQYAAELRRIELMERLGHLVPVTNLSQAVCEVGGAIVAKIDRLAVEADRLAAAYSKEGTPGIRVELKKILRELRTAIASDLREMAANHQRKGDALIDDCWRDMIAFQRQAEHAAEAAPQAETNPSTEQDEINVDERNDQAHSD